ncbi:MAG: ATP-binding protein [Puia sp.]|nr:ATP-binding protein [Puia sp.]
MYGSNLTSLVAVKIICSRCSVRVRKHLLLWLSEFIDLLISGRSRRSNIAKHAKAGKVEVRLNADLRRVTMEIHDDGVGFDTRQRGKGIGITNIYNRVESYNGRVEIISDPGNGCTSSLTLPLAE